MNGQRLVGARLLVGYAVVLAFLAVATTVSLLIGRDLDHPPEVAGSYSVGQTSCLEAGFELTQSGEFVDLAGKSGGSGKLRLSDGRLTGDISCADGSSAEVDLALQGEEDDPALVGTIDARPVTAVFEGEPAEGGRAAAEPRGAEETFGRLMLAIAVVILVARLFGVLLGKLGQPRVMGEIIAGILLGPTLLGAVAPDVKDYLFPADIIPLLSAAASIGLAFYLFLVGMELNPTAIRERAREAAFISNTSVAFPMALGLLVALPVYELLAPDADYLPFALFMGVAMSITAFPVLARILVERRMLRRPVGALAMAGAAIDDVTAWGLLALATAVAGAGSGIDALVVVGLAGAFTAALIIGGRPVMRRLSTAYDEVGHIPPLWVAGIFVSVLLAAFAAQQIGIAPIFGAFIVGLIMPRHAGLTEDLSRRLEDFVVTVLLPLFFVVTGLKVEIGALDRWQLWVVALVLLVAAVVGKWIGAMLAARFSGFSWRDSTALGALMNTRGLTELIVLNIGLELGLISTGLFTMLVLMAIVTTFMAGPALRLLDPRGELSEPPEEAFRRSVGEAAAAAPERAILVAPQEDRNIDAVLALAEPLARSQPPRELVVVRLLRPMALSAGLVSEDRQLHETTTELEQRRELLLERGVQARIAAFTAADSGADLVRLASEPNIDLVLLNGRRPLLGEGIPGGNVGYVLQHAPCDVGVLVDREGVPTIDEAHPVVVPFGGGEHDWAAVELGAWIAASQGAKLKLLGAAAGGEDGSRDASRLLANTSLVLQQLAGITAEPTLVTPGREVIEAARGAGLLVVGLSDRWREEGLSDLRLEIAKSAPAATLFVRRGERAGALAPRDDMTRFRWSAAGIAAPTPFQQPE